MPRIKDLDRFKRDLVALSRENEVLAQWGETREDLPLPTEEAQAPTESVDREIPRPQRGAIPEDAAPDFASLLAGAGPKVEATEPSEPPSADAELEALLGLPPELSTTLDTDIAELPEATEDRGVTEDLAGAFDLGAFASAMEESSLDAVGTEGGGEVEAEIPSDVAPISPIVETPTEDFNLADFGSFDAETPGTAAGETRLDEFGLGGESAAGEAPSPAATEEMPGIEADSNPFGEAGFDLPSLEEPVKEPVAEAEPPVSDETLLESTEPGLADAGPVEEELAELGAFEEEAGEPAPKATAGGEAAIEPGSGFDDVDIPDFGDAEAPPTPSTASTETGAQEPLDFGNFDLGSEASPAAPGTADAFDSFSFEPAQTGLAGEALDKELASLGDDSGSAATFNLEGPWGGFGGEVEEEAPRPAAERGGSQAGSKEAIRTVSLTEGQVDRLQDSLLALPLNLRIAVEDIVANEKGSEGQRSSLVWMLVEGGRPDAIASAAGKILKRRIAVPVGFERRTGAAYLAQQGSLSYLFIHTILPILRTALIAILVAGALGYLGWKFVYRPLAATALYRTGYTRIAQDRFPEAEEAFKKASEIREFITWYYRYAEAYAAKRRYILAETRYSELLRKHPAETAASMALARLQREQLKYREAVGVLDKYILDRRPLDRQALLLEGDIFLDWAEEDPRRYEDGRKRYATLIENFGTSDQYLERMLRYFIRVDKLREVLPLKNRFLAMKTKPLAASTMAELGGYLLDKGEMPDVLRILKEALGKDQLHPETHYQLGRYYRKSGNDAEETKALDNSIAGFRRLPALGKRNLVMYLEDLVRRGDLRLARKEYFTAEDDFGAAVVEYERALDLHRLEKNPAFGKAYAGLGEISYWGKEDLDGALAYYERAAANGWDSPEIRYKRGFIDYRRGRIADALTQFYLSGRDGDGNPYLLYSFGNALLERADFHAAEGYYRRVVETMTDAFDALDYPIPQEKRSDRAIVELLMESQNNLGVALFRIGDRMGNAKLRADAAAAFTESARLFDILVHDSRSLLAADAMNLGYLNLDYALHPRRGIDLGSYKPIPKDMTWPLN